MVKLQEAPTFKKTLKQIECTKMMAGPARHNMALGGSRSGKTATIVRAIIIRACKTRSRHVSLRRTFNSIKTSMWMDTIPKVLRLAFPDLQVHFDKSNYVLIFPNGSEYWVAGLDDDKRVEKILGKEFSTIHFNECTQLSYASVQIALTRLAEKNNLAKKVYYDMNPGAKNSWSYYQFEKKLNPVDNEPLKDPDNYVSIMMNPIDNIENIDEEYLSMLESLPGKEKRRFLYGEYTDCDDGIVYYSFSRGKHVRLVELDSGTMMIGMDFNVDPMTAVIGQFIDEIFYIFDEVYLPNSDTYKMIDALRRKKYQGNIYPDSTGKNRKTSGMSDHYMLNQAGFTVVPTRNPFVTDRTNNINRLLQEDRIIIDPKCKKLINDLEKVSWKNNELDQTTDKSLTHISDALGYMCWKLAPLKRILKSTSRKG